MRVGLLIYGSLETVSGGYLYDRLLVDFLYQRGHSVEIVSIPWRNYAAHLGDNWSKELRQKLRQLQIDLLLQDELNHPSLAWLNPWLKAQVGYPLVSIVHHLRISENHSRLVMPFYRMVEKRYLRTVDGFVYNSQTTQHSVETQLANKRPSMVVFPSASHIAAPSNDEIEFEVVRKASLSPFRILFVGNLIERKGLHNLVAGLTQLNFGEWQLDIVGNSEVDVNYTARIRRQIEQAGLPDRAIIHGKVDTQRLQTMFSQAHLLAVPSYEGFGIVYLEAMASGVPVIATTAGAAHEIVEPGMNGFLVTPNVAGQIAERICEVAADRQHWLAMARAARQRFEQHPTWEEGFSRLEIWLQQLV